MIKIAYINMYSNVYIILCKLTHAVVVLKDIYYDFITICKTIMWLYVATFEIHLSLVLLRWKIIYVEPICDWILDNIYFISLLQLITTLMH